MRVPATDEERCNRITCPKPSQVTRSPPRQGLGERPNLGPGPSWPIGPFRPRSHLSPLAQFGTGPTYLHLERDKALSTKYEYPNIHI